MADDQIDVGATAPLAPPAALSTPAAAAGKRRHEESEAAASSGESLSVTAASAVDSSTTEQSPAKKQKRSSSGSGNGDEYADSSAAASSLEANQMHPRNIYRNKPPVSCSCTHKSQSMSTMVMIGVQRRSVARLSTRVRISSRWPSNILNSNHCQSRRTLARAWPTDRLLLMHILAIGPLCALLSVRVRRSPSSGAYGVVDWTDPGSLLALTTVLLRHDFGLRFAMPPGHLCPPVPQRLNYVHWVADLLGVRPGDEANGRIRGVDVSVRTAAECERRATRSHRRRSLSLACSCLSSSTQRHRRFVHLSSPRSRNLRLELRRDRGGRGECSSGRGECAEEWTTGAGQSGQGMKVRACLGCAYWPRASLILDCSLCSPCRSRFVMSLIATCCLMACSNRRNGQ
jgi:hypothetical protein